MFASTACPPDRLGPHTAGRLASDSIPGPFAPARMASFQTPPQLLAGFSYRVLVDKVGFEQMASDWVTLGTERTALTPFRIRAMRRMTGTSAITRVTRSSGRRSSSQQGDHRPRPTQGPLHAGPRRALKSFVLADAAGFRFQGWPVDATSQADNLALTIGRTGEPPERLKLTLPDAFPFEESRALGLRVLEPYLQASVEKKGTARPSCRRRTLWPASTRSGRSNCSRRPRSTPSVPFETSYEKPSPRVWRAKTRLRPSGCWMRSRPPAHAGAWRCWSSHRPPRTELWKVAMLDRATVQVRSEPRPLYKPTLKSGSSPRSSSCCAMTASRPRSRSRPVDRSHGTYRTSLSAVGRSPACLDPKAAGRRLDSLGPAAGTDPYLPANHVAP